MCTSATMAAAWPPAGRQTEIKNFSTQRTRELHQDSKSILQLEPAGRTWGTASRAALHSQMNDIGISTRGHRDITVGKGWVFEPGPLGCFTLPNSQGRWGKDSHGRLPAVGEQTGGCSAKRQGPEKTDPVLTIRSKFQPEQHRIGSSHWHHVPYVSRSLDLTSFWGQSATSDL